jgi:glycosyltransferase involved in cell wall biosynthesis
MIAAMRVLAIAQSGTLGGAERSLLSLARRLPEHGVEVDIAAPRGELAHAAAGAGVTVHDVDLGPVTAGRWQQAPLAWPRLLRIARPDVYLLNGVVAHRAVPALRGAPRVPYLHERVERAPRAWRSRRFWRSVPLVLCGSHSVASAARDARAPSARMRVVGVPVEAAQPAPRPEWADGTPVVGFAGRLDAAKAPLDLVAAMSELDARLVLVGDAEPAALAGSDRRAAADYASRVRAGAAALGDRAVLLGRVPTAAALMPWFDVLVMPSLREGLGLAALEALSAGTPVVVSSEVGVAELVKEGTAGEVVPPGDPAALAAAISRVLAGGGDRADSARAVAAPFAAELVTAEVAAALKQAAGG